MKKTGDIDSECLICKENLFDINEIEISSEED